MVDPNASRGSSPRRGLRILVTGATSGIGTETVRRLSRDGAELLVHGRSPERVGALVQELSGSGAVATPWVADLASLAETSRLASRVVAEGGIDVLINNAGVGFGADKTLRETSRDGFELRFAVNYLAPWLLTERLLASGAVRRAVLHVASIGQQALDLDDLNSTASYHGVTAYRRSKLALIMHAFDVAESVPGVSCDAFHPGSLLDTAMVRNASITPRGPASRGAEVAAHVLDRALGAAVTGRYYDETREARADPQAYDVAVRRRLRELTTVLTAPFAG